MSAVLPYRGLGRRKTAVARVRLTPGTGVIMINGRPLDSYVPTERLRRDLQNPLRLTETLGRYDVQATVDGGGISGQVGALILGIARALVKAEPSAHPVLRRHGLLTRDDRMVERKKYGLHKARRGCQFSKR
ncbi:MAG: 30S ribosomal protein S9 [Planctomycetota bacterium]|nr:30S ribosomal protein S9 [Planctomycetota bacterium]MCX8039244.1 30S ribosomal protein S9 [Planctomycetota bacterium]MDW8372647.1 30S ribosomal protein S9 [Planctomycetota bacterium]